MSHVATVDLVVKDLSALKTACAELGLEFHEGQKTHRYYRSQQAPCDHALRVKGDCEAYEIGVIKQPNGSYSLSWDSFDRRLRQCVGANCNKLKQKYATHVVMNHAPKIGMRAVQRIKTDGSIEITLEK